MLNIIENTLNSIKKNLFKPYSKILNLKKNYLISKDQIKQIENQI
jgi:hypothetical protein